MFELSILFLWSKFCTQYNPSSESAVQSSMEIVQYKASRQEWSGLFPTSESLSLVIDPIRNNSALKGGAK